jgi:hypothetical protein
MMTVNENLFPSLPGEALAWSIGLYTTHAEKALDYPRARAVINAMIIHRPVQLERERREMVKASFGKMFGHNAAECLRIIETTISEHKALASIEC